MYACALLRRLVSRPEPAAPSNAARAQTPRRSGPGPRPSPPTAAAGVTGGAGAQCVVLDAPVPGAAAGATGRPPVCPAPGRLSASAELARESVAPYAAAGALADAHATGASRVAAAPGVGEGQVEGLLPPPVPAAGVGQAAGVPPKAPLAEVVHAARSRSGLPALVAAAVQNCKARSPAPVHGLLCTGHSNQKSEHAKLSGWNRLTCPTFHTMQSPCVPWQPLINRLAVERVESFCRVQNLGCQDHLLRRKSNIGLQTL